MNKGKIIIISAGVFLILLIVVIFAFINGGSDKENTNGTPPLLNTKDSLTYKDMIDLNQNNNYGVEEKTPVDNTKEVEERLSNIYAGSNESSSTPVQQSAPTPSYSSPSSSYSPYGNRDMYTIPEKRSKPNYEYRSNDNYSTNLPPVVHKEIEEKPVQRNNSTPPVISSNNNRSNLQNRKAKFEGGNNNSTSNQETKAIIRGEQKIGNGQNLRIALSESTTIGGVNVPKGTIIYANARFNDDRVDLAINTFKVGTKIVNGSNLKVFSNDGLEGIPINTSQLMVNGKQIATNEAKQQISSYGGRVGGLISQLIKSKQDFSITFLDNQILYLK